MTALGLEIVLMIGLLCHDFTITNYLNRKKLAHDQKDYEQNFMKHHEARLEECSLRLYNDPKPEGEFLPEKQKFIELLYEEGVVNDLKEHCIKIESRLSPHHFWHKHNVKKYEPKKEYQYLAFYRQTKFIRPVNVEMIRCTEKYAMITAEDHRSTYLLVALPHTKLDDELTQSITPDTDIFRILLKLSPKKDKTLEKKKSSKNGQSIHSTHDETDHKIDQNDKLQNSPTLGKKSSKKGQSVNHAHDNHKTDHEVGLTVGPLNSPKHDEVQSK